MTRLMVAIIAAGLVVMSLLLLDARAAEPLPGAGLLNVLDRRLGADG